MTVGVNDNAVIGRRKNSRRRHKWAHKFRAHSPLSSITLSSLEFFAAASFYESDLCDNLHINPYYDILLLELLLILEINT